MGYGCLQADGLRACFYRAVRVEPELPRGAVGQCWQLLLYGPDAVLSCDSCVENLNVIATTRLLCSDIVCWQPSIPCIAKNKAAKQSGLRSNQHLSGPAQAAMV